MILITSAKYLSSDFTLEFGEIPPSFLPLGNKRLYEFQVELFENIKQKIFLSLPKSFCLNKFDQEKLDKLGVELIFVPENLSLGESIVYCLNITCMFDEKLYILHGDTFFKKLSFNDNSLQIASVKENYNWVFLDDDFDINLKNKDKNLILAGAYSIAYPHFLIKDIIENDYSFIEGMKAYSQKFCFDVINNDTWLDFGLITNYFHSKQVVSTQRSFNDIKIKNGYIEKTSTWKEKIKAEMNWFDKLPKDLIIYIPKVITKENSYNIEYLYNNTLAELLVFGKLPDYVWKRIFSSLKDFLNTLHSFKSNDTTINFNYKEKTLQRLKEFSKQNDFSLEKPIVINNKTYPSILQLLEKLDLVYGRGCKENFSFIHGDFCFSNIMYDFRANMVKTFDPRGMDFNSKITPFGDENYDFAKLTHSILGLYDFIIAGFFECSFKEQKFNFSIQEDHELLKIQEAFLEIFAINNHIKTITIHLFLSMLPLHNDSQKRQMALLANAYRLYDKFFKGKK